MLFMIICPISILNRSTLFKDFNGSNHPTYLHIFVILCGNSWDIESNPGPNSHHTSHVGYVMLMLDGRTVGFVVILAISGII